MQPICLFEELARIFCAKQLMKGPCPRKFSHDEHAHAVKTELDIWVEARRPDLEAACDQIISFPVVIEIRGKPNGPHAWFEWLDPEWLKIIDLLPGDGQLTFSRLPDSDDGTMIHKYAVDGIKPEQVILEDRTFFQVLDAFRISNTGRVFVKDATGTIVGTITADDCCTDLGMMCLFALVRELEIAAASRCRRFPDTWDRLDSKRREELAGFYFGTAVAGQVAEAKDFIPHHSPKNKFWKSHSLLKQRRDFWKNALGELDFSAFGNVGPRTTGSGVEGLARVPRMLACMTKDESVRAITERYGPEEDKRELILSVREIAIKEVMQCATLRDKAKMVGWCTKERQWQPLSPEIVKDVFDLGFLIRDRCAHPLHDDFSFWDAINLSVVELANFVHDCRRVIDKLQAMKD